MCFLFTDIKFVDTLGDEWTHSYIVDDIILPYTHSDVLACHNMKKLLPAASICLNIVGSDMGISFTSRPSVLGTSVPLFLTNLAETGKETATSRLRCVWYSDTSSWRTKSRSSSRRSRNRELASSSGQRRSSNLTRLYPTISRTRRSSFPASNGRVCRRGKKERKELRTKKSMSMFVFFSEFFLRKEELNA